VCYLRGATITVNLNLISMNMSNEKTIDVREPVKATERLKDVSQPAYNKILDFLKTLNQDKYYKTDQEYKTAIFVIGNQIYLIYELLHLNIVREIDYTDIKNFAVKNNDFVKYTFKKLFSEFSIEALDSWTQVNIDLLECAMYTNSNKSNKHIYH
jgi:hypothetical protein